MENIIETEELTKKFDDFIAVDKLSLNVKKNEIFGFLGPNGAGKSTTIRMLCTLTQPTSGTATVAGYDLLKEHGKVRENIGLVSEKMIMYDRLTTVENLRFFGKLYDIPKKELEKRIDELLELVDMRKWKDTQISKFSTGMKQRINVIRALVPQPKIIFLDEPTLGLDPQTTFSIRDIIRDINRKGVTVILTTHAMTEAEVLSDRVAIIDQGRVVTINTPENLKSKISKDKTVLKVRIKNLTSSMMKSIQSLDFVTGLVQQGDYNLEISAKGSDSLDKIIETIKGQGGVIKSMNTSGESTLEDVFLDLTGKDMRDHAGESASVHPGHSPKARVR